MIGDTISEAIELRGRGPVHPGDPRPEQGPEGRDAARGCQRHAPGGENDPGAGAQVSTSTQSGPLVGAQKGPPDARLAGPRRHSFQVAQPVRA